MKKDAEAPGAPESPAAIDKTSGSRQANRTASSFAGAYYDYRKSINRIWADAQEQSQTADRDYRDVVRGVHDDVQRRAEETYRKFLNALQDVWGTEEAKTRAQEIYESYLRDLGQLWTPDDSLKCWEAHNTYVRTLSDIWSPDRLRSKASEAYRNYGQQLKDAWGAADVEKLDQSALASISHSMLSVASCAP